MEGTQEAQKPVTTVEDLEQIMGTYKQIEAKAAEKELPEYLQMILLCAATECMPEHLRQYGKQLLSVKFAQKAYEAFQNGRKGDASGYTMLAEHYAKQGGIDLTSKYDQLKKNLGPGLKEESEGPAKKGEAIYGGGPAAAAKGSYC